MKFNHTATFSAEIFAAKQVPQFTEHRQESLASLKELAPSYWETKNIDLLAVAFDAAVINQFNANDDGIASNVSLQVMDKFRHKPINIEHDRSRIIGHITDAACTDRSTHAFIWEDDAAQMSMPYNLSLGGFVYKMVNADFYEELEDSMNPQSPNYQSISASWEVGFNSFAIALGSVEVQHAEIITNPIEIAKYAEYLRAFGGKGMTEDGRRVYRLITGDVYPLGIGFVKNPAADVKGIHNYKNDAECDKRDKIAAKKRVFITNKEPDISQSEKSNVKTHDSKISMEELLKQLKEALASQDKVTEEVAANIAKQFAEKIKEADVEYRQKLSEKEEAIAKEKKEREALKSQVEEISEKLQAAEQTIQAFKDKEAAEALATVRDQRLEQIDSLYELDDEDRKVIIAELANFDVTSDEAFEAYAGKLAVLLRHKNKEAIAAAQAKAEEAKKIEEAKASKEEKPAQEAKASEEKTEEEILAKAKANEEAAPSNNQGDQDDSLVKKFAKAITKENVKIQY